MCDIDKAREIVQTYVRFMPKCERRKRIRCHFSGEYDVDNDNRNDKCQSIREHHGQQRAPVVMQVGIAELTLENSSNSSTKRPKAL
jgi:hypothetical protein